MTKDAAYRQAEKKIEETYRTGSRELSLRNMGLTELPETISKLAKLTEIDISRNKLKALPEPLKELKKLRVINTEINKIVELPEFIGQYVYLEQLLVGGNQITALPDSLGYLNNLHELDIAGNQIKSFPYSFENLRGLSSLSLGHNRLGGNLFSDLPSSIRKLKELNYLSANNLHLKNLPEWVGELSKLTSLYLNNNQLTDLPLSIGLLENLEVCDLDGNQIINLPPSITELRYLRILSLNDNPLHPELSRAYEQGLDTLKSYLQGNDVPNVDFKTAVKESKDKHYQQKLKVFLSYASQDRYTVHALCRKLAETEWIEPWLDAKDLLPGQNWQAEIKNAVETTDSVIIFLSNTSVNKDGFIQKELRFARDIAEEKIEGSIFLIPLRLDDCEVPRNLKTYQWADYFGPEQEQTYEKLLSALKRRFEDIKERHIK
jgi:Leucine-rich repeat (LRR) protein